MLEALAKAILSEAGHGIAAVAVLMLCLWIHWWWIVKPQCDYHRGVHDDE